jgi:ppGpp synthetase/RelA/SpoT-type nucleotidyltranferase
MAVDLEALRRRYSEELPQYESLAAHVDGLLRKETVAAGIRCDIDHRVKSVASFLKKVLRKQHEGSLAAGQPVYDQVRDKAGIRVVANYQGEVVRAEAVVQRLFPHAQREDKAQDLEHSNIGYLGVHYDAVLPDDRLGPEEEGLRNLPCEIQVHTRAQSAWAKVAHELAYKAFQPPEEGVLRMIYRLAPLMEIFDDQAQRAREAIHNQPGFPEAVVLDELEEHFYRFTGRDFDRLLSLEIIHELWPLIEGAGQPYGPAIDAFVQQYHAKLEEIFERYAEDDRNLLLSQPESLLVFEQLERDPFRLTAQWNQGLPMDLLEPLGDAWGKPIGAFT